MKYTSERKLKKPEYSDPRDIEVLNENMDKLDNHTHVPDEIKTDNNKQFVSQDEKMYWGEAFRQANEAYNYAGGAYSYAGNAYGLADSKVDRSYGAFTSGFRVNHSSGVSTIIHDVASWQGTGATGQILKITIPYISAPSYLQMELDVMQYSNSKASAKILISYYGAAGYPSVQIIGDLDAPIAAMKCGGAGSAGSGSFYFELGGVISSGNITPINFSSIRNVILSKVTSRNAVSNYALNASWKVELVSANTTFSGSDVYTSTNVKRTINTSDVVDNLTSTDSYSPLSANQGNILKVTKANISDVDQTYVGKSFSSFSTGFGVRHNDNTVFTNLHDIAYYNNTSASSGGMLVTIPGKTAVPSCGNLEIDIMNGGANNYYYNKLLIGVGSAYLNMVVVGVGMNFSSLKAGVVGSNYCIYVASTSILRQIVIRHFTASENQSTYLKSGWTVAGNASEPTWTGTATDGTSNIKRATIT